MPAVSISQLPAGLALTGAELLPAVQGGATVRTTVTQLRSGLAGDDHTHGEEDIAGLSAALAAMRRTGRRTLWVPAAGMHAPSVAGAAEGLIETAGSGLVLPVRDFDADTAEAVSTIIALPKAWDGGPLAVQLLWTADAAGDVVWSVAGAALEPGGALDVSSGIAVTASTAAPAAGMLLATAEAGPLSLAGTPSPTGLVALTVVRMAGDLADTLSADARLVGLRLFYAVDAANDG